jgi:hypothetical protein
MLGCSLPCSVVAASAEPRRAAVVLRLANLVVVNQPLPVRATGRRSSTSERSRLSRHHAASQADAARPNQAAVHLPPRHVLLNVERTVERVLLLVPLKVQTVPLHVQATVLRHVHQKRAAVLLRVHRSVLLLADQKVLTVPHHVRQSVLLPADLRAQHVLQPADLLARAVPLRVHLNVHRLAEQKVQTAPHHVHQSVLQPVVQRVLTAPHHVPKHVVLSVAQAVLQPAVPKVPAAVTIVAVQTLAKSLS